VRGYANEGASTPITSSGSLPNGIVLPMIALSPESCCQNL
jgi:hypothetical protein